MSQLGSPFLKITALCALLMPALVAQNTPVTVRATNNEARFWVDGSPYRGVQTFNWPVKSKHVLEIREPQQFLSGWRDTRLNFNGWSDPSGYTMNREIFVIEADPKIPEYTAAFGVEHKLTVWFNDTQIPWGINEYNEPQVDNAEPRLRPSAYGLITSEGVGAWSGCILNSRYGWVPEGTSVLLNAIPYPGYAFQKWLETDDADNRYPFIRVAVNSPRVVRAYFAVARRHTFETWPVRGLRISVDGVETDTRQEAGACLPPGQEPTPAQELVLPDYDGEFCPVVPPLCTGDRDLIPGSEHMLTAKEVQRDSKGILWVFDHWDWGGAEKPGANFRYVVPKETDDRTMTAHFVRGVDTTILTEPNGLKLMIDGRSDWNAYNFVWGVGQKHTLSAPAEQTDAQGRRWVFKSWSNQGAATQEVAAEMAHLGPGMVLRAQYELLGQVTITSDNASPLFLVGDRECRAPCTVDLPAGTRTVVKVLPEEVLSEDIKIKFLGWHDGDMSVEREFTFTGDRTLLSAKFVVLNRLRLVSDPEDGVDFGLSPQPAEGLWYPMGEEVTLTAEPRRGYRFRRWDGALAGTVPNGWVRMNTPLTVVARLDKIPALKDGAVRNAAELLPGDGVAPGSLIAIDGINMAAYPEQSPKFPLKQSIQGIYVQAEGRILPLISVSPETIVALLPSDMKLGEFALIVKTPNEPDMNTELKVVRNAPGLFWKTEGELFLADAYHADGKPVTIADPARKGEVIRVRGTGFGPLNPLPPDGFPLPGDPVYRMNDPARITLEEREFAVESVAGAPGTHGEVWLRIRITEAMPAGRLARLTVRVNGVESSPVSLPLQ